MFTGKISLIENLSPGNEVNKDCMKIDAHGKKIYCSMSNWNLKPVRFFSPSLNWFFFMSLHTVNEQANERKITNAFFLFNFSSRSLLCETEILKMSYLESDLFNSEKKHCGAVLQTTSVKAFIRLNVVFLLFRRSSKFHRFLVLTTWASAKAFTYTPPPCTHARGIHKITHF